MFLGVIFSQKEEFPLLKNNLLTTLSSVQREYSISFEVIVTKHTYYSWRNIIHLTTGGNFGQLGYRIPGVWLNKDNQLQIGSAVNGNSYHFTHPKPLSEGRWYRIEIDQIKRDTKVFCPFDFLSILSFQYFYEVRLDSSLIHSIENILPDVYNDVKVYVADPWVPAVDGMTRNIVIINMINGK